jgi:hypothetical protein
MIEESLEPVAPTEESWKSKKATLAEGIREGWNARRARHAG